MSSPNAHPMDDFPVRPLNFEAVSGDRLVWSRTCPQFSVFLNALALHVPYFERYLIAAMRAAREQVSDAGLRRDMTAIIGQEAHHSKNFVRINEALVQRYPALGAVDAQARDHFAQRAETDSLQRLVGFTAGYETFTFLAGMIILQNYDKWFADSDPVLKALWVWHQVEEVEHGAVAFEVYQSLYGEHEMYRKWMVVVAACHIAWETFKAYVPMIRREGWTRNPLKGLSRMVFCASMLLRLARAALPVLRRGYHPRKHPMVTSDQNPIQIAWRRYEAEGGDVLAIDHRKMSEILGAALP
jgi:predicted metal-dependent hydrolase